MKVLIDACVLYPTVMREVVLGVAAEGLFEPMWSARILEEWARATVKLGEGHEVVARGEVAALRARWPQAEVTPHERDLTRLSLPDENDVHVMAAALAGGADMILTLNMGDFPARVLANEGLSRETPDQFLRRLYDEDPAALTRVAERVRAEAERLSGEAWPIRKLMKKARLPRLGKVLDAAGMR